MKRFPAALLAATLALSLAGCSYLNTAPESTPAPVQPTATPTATPEPTPTPEPGINPLTGQEDPDGALRGKRPVAVQIRTGDGTLPQWGIARADLVIEGVTEDSTAGMLAVFSSVDQQGGAGGARPGSDAAVCPAPQRHSGAHRQKCLCL